MSYNRKAITDALSKMNKARKPKQPKDIIKDPEGQYKYPGVPTRIASDNITMQGVPYPVLGVDNLGNQQMMQPGADYIFPGADYVDEFPMMQGGGQRPPIYVDPNDPAGKARYRAYQDSLNLYKAYEMQDKLMGPGNKKTNDTFKWNTAELKEGRKKKYIPSLKGYYARDFQSEEEQFKDGFDLWTARKEDKQLLDYYKKLGFKPNQIMYHSSPDIVSDKIKAIGSYFDGNAVSPIYKKPTQPVKYRNPKVVAKQQQLIDAGYDIGPTGADGDWGKKSKAAWEEFQAQQSIAPKPEVIKTIPEQTQQPLSPVTETTQSTTPTPQQVPAAPQPPIGYNVWTHNGQTLDPTIYGWAPSDSPRQISQFASTHALERANKAYTKLNATPWATEGNKLVTDLYKPYFSKTAATNALVPTAEQLGVSVDQLRIEKAPVGYSGYVVIQKLPQQKYGGLVTGLTNTSGNLLMNEKGKRMMAQSGSLFATNKMFLGNPMVTKRKKSVFVPGAPFQNGGNTSNPGMDAMMKARFAYAHMHGNPAAQRMTYPVDNPYIFTGTEPYTNPDMAGEFGTHYMFSQDNYAVPTIQQDEYGNLIYNPEANYTNPEAIQFDRPEDAEYFAKYYKQIAPGMQTGGSTNWKSKIASAMNFQKGGQKDKWGRSPESKWYGFNPKTKQWTKELKENKKDYFQQSLDKQLNQAQPSETIQQSRGQTIESQKAAEDTQEILRKERNKQATLPKNFEADTRSDAQRERDQTAAEQLTDPNLKQQIANALQAPLFQAGNFWDYLAGGDDWKQAQQEYNLNQLNPYSQNKMSNFLSTGLSNTGNALMTGMEIADGYALARAIPGIQNQVGRYLSKPSISNTPRQLPGSGVASSVDDVGKGLTQAPKPAWQMQELPGLHLKSTMEGEAISKIVEPKTGLVNVEQALAIIGKESGGADKVALIKQGLGDDIPKKMDYNEFRKVVQDQLIPLERQFSTQSSGYGINRIGYNPESKKMIDSYNTSIEGLKKTISDNEKILNSGKYEGFTANEIQDFINQEKLKLKQIQNNLENIVSTSPLENQTIILGNKNKFGRGSSAHGNPDETLGHIHFLRDAEHPNIGIATQIQSDAFQGTHRVMPKSKEAAEFSYKKGLEHQENLKKIYENARPKMESGLDIDGNPYWYELSDGTTIHKDAYFEGIHGQQKLNSLQKAEIENFTQKQLLDKNHQERFLQEFMDYAGKRGDLDYIAIPKPKTAAKVQGYQKGNPSQEFINSQTKLRQEIVDALEKYGENSIEFKQLNNKYNKLLKDNSLGGYSKEHQTILKKYSEYEKMAKKLGWETDNITIKGNEYTRIAIPKKFKEGKGEIKAFNWAIPATIATGAAASQYKQGGSIQPLDYFDTELTDQEIEQYKKGGCVVVKL